MKAKKFIRLFLIICLSFFTFTFVKVNDISHANEIELKYDFTLLDDAYTISSGTTYAGINLAIEEILLDATTDVVTINFNNIEIDESIIVGNISKNLILSGTVTSNITDSLIIFENDENEVFVNLDTLSLTDNNSNILITNNSDCESINLNVKNCNLSSEMLNSYSILSKNAEFYLSLGGDNTFTTTYFSNYNDTIYLSFSQEPTNQIPLSFVADYDISRNSLMTSYPSYGSKICFVTKNSFYSINYHCTENDFTIYSKLTCSLDANGGEYTSNPIETFFYNDAYYFPSSSQIKKSNGTATLGGWFGKIEIDGENYFFGKEEIVSLSEVENITLETLKSYLQTDINDTQTALDAYEYSEEESFETYFSFFMPYEFNKVPTFICKWKYKITYKTNSTETIEDCFFFENEEITLETPDSAYKTGYDFENWYTNSKLTTLFNEEIMPSNNVTVYAKWVPKTMTITFYKTYTSNDENVIYKTETCSYGSTIDFDLIISPNQNGYTFKGWYYDLDYSLQVDSTNAVTENTKIFAKWQIRKYNVTFVLDGGTLEQGTNNVQIVEYNQKATEPQISKTGHEFKGWFCESALENEYNFDSLITSDTYIYAKWSPKIYTLTFYVEGALYYETNAVFNQIIQFPTNVTKVGFRFENIWYEDENYETKFTKSNMPADNLKLYSKFSPKLDVTINEIKTNIEATSQEIGYKVSSTLSNFIVYYKVDDIWTTQVPQKIGTYDVKVTRQEDSNYTYFETIVQNGLTISPVKKDILWIGIVATIVFVIELVVTCFIVHLRKLKTSRIYVVFPFIVDEIYEITKDQFIFVIVSASLAVVGFVFMIYELVKLTNATYNYDFTPAKSDFRGNRKDEIKFQEDEQNSDPTFIVPTKTEESFGSKYSAKDIRDMLDYDKFGEKIKRNKKFSPEIVNTYVNDKYQNEPGSPTLKSAIERKNVQEDEFSNGTIAEIIEDDDGENELNWQYDNDTLIDNFDDDKKAPSEDFNNSQDEEI